jgi:hypothetical protein
MLNNIVIQYPVDQFTEKHFSHEEFWNKDHSRNEERSIAMFRIEIMTTIPRSHRNFHTPSVEEHFKILFKDYPAVQNSIVATPEPGDTFGHWEVLSDFDTFEDAIKTYPALRSKMESIANGEGY